jgi:hypothetical protein
MGASISVVSAGGVREEEELVQEQHTPDHRRVPGGGSKSVTCAGSASPLETGGCDRGHLLPLRRTTRCATLL